MSQVTWTLCGALLMVIAGFIGFLFLFAVEPERQHEVFWAGVATVSMFGVPGAVCLYLGLRDIMPRSAGRFVRRRATAKPVATGLATTACGVGLLLAYYQLFLRFVPLAMLGAVLVLAGLFYAASFMKTVCKRCGARLSTEAFEVISQEGSVMERWAFCATCQDFAVVTRRGESTVVSGTEARTRVGEWVASARDS
jgi:hypothetical protein